LSLGWPTVKNFFYGQTLWDYGVNDIPEVMALDPEEAVWVVVKARELYWARPLGWRDDGLEVVCALFAVLVIVGAGALLGDATVGVSLAFAAIFTAWPFVRKREKSKFRPYVFAALKARGHIGTGPASQTQS